MFVMIGLSVQWGNDYSNLCVLALLLSVLIITYKLIQYHSAGVPVDGATGV